MKMPGRISSATQSPAAARPSLDGGWCVVFPSATGTHNPRSRETTRVTPFAHLHIGSFANSLKFSFSAKERDTETGLSYFGARYYSSDLSIWLSVDPMSGKYPSLSPYVYCANNPVKLVDPNGEEVIVGEYTYNNGKLYDKDGNEFTPKPDSFEEKVLNSLNTLKKTTEGRMLMAPFEGEKGKDVKIINADKRQDKQGRSGFGNVVYDFETGTFKEATIYWNPEGTTLPTTKGFLKNATTDLGHEFSHAYDRAVGRSYKTGSTGGISNDEWMAVYRENLIRGELGEAYRTHYNWTKSVYTDNATGLEKILYEPNGAKMLQGDQPYLPWK